MKCNQCVNVFTEELNVLNKEKTYPEKFKIRTIVAVLNSDIKNIAKYSY